MNESELMELNNKRFDHAAVKSLPKRLSLFSLLRPFDERFDHAAVNSLPKQIPFYGQFAVPGQVSITPP